MADTEQRDARSTTLNGYCRNKCGVRSLFTCSCDTRCKILRNCCKDLQSSCPLLFSESNSRFQKLTQLLQECDPSDYLLVSGCPQDSSLFKRVDTDIVTRLQSISEGQGALNRLFSHVPVTDLDSGITFKNVSVYLCNNMPGRNLQFWNVNIDMFTLGPNGVLTYDEISRVHSAVFPPTQLDKYKDIFQCYFDDMTKLKISSSQQSKMFSPEFKSLESLCALCSKPTNTAENGNHSAKEVRSQFTFPIIASFENDQFIFQPYTSYGGIEIVPWQQMQCLNLKTNKGKNSVIDSSCSIISCTTEFELTAEGQCKILYILQLAVPDDKIPMTKSFLSRLSSYFECYLNKYSGYDVVDKWHVSERFSDDALQEKFYITQLLLYSSEVLDISNIDVIKDAEKFYSNFTKAIHVLRSYRSRLKVHDYETSMETLPMKTFDFRYLNIKSKRVNYDSSNAIPVCADFLPKSYLNYPILHNLHLKCIYISDQDNESNKTREVMEIENNTCLNVFTFSAQNALNFSSHLSISLLLVFFTCLGTCNCF